MLVKLERRLADIRSRFLVPGVFHVATAPRNGGSTVVQRPKMPTFRALGLRSSPSVPRPRSLQEAIHWTILYSAIFDYPLTAEEIHRFLIVRSASRQEVDSAIADMLLRGQLESDGQFLYPTGQSSLVATRSRRSQHARQAWKRTHAYARLLWLLPYVRMVAVTGALAMDNVEQSDDIDFLIVTQRGRVWLTRGMILIVVKMARIRGDTICPNFIMSTQALELEQRNTYTAHELAQMIPLYGGQMAECLWTKNAWYRDFLPNAWRNTEEVADDEIPRILMLFKELGQMVLDLPFGTFVEQWEQRRKIRKLSGESPGCAREILYTSEMCKGHVDGHGDRILNRWTAEITVPGQ